MRYATSTSDVFAAALSFGAFPENVHAVAVTDVAMDVGPMVPGVSVASNGIEIHGAVFSNAFNTGGSGSVASIDVSRNSIVAEDLDVRDSSEGAVAVRVLQLRSVLFSAPRSNLTALGNSIDVATRNAGDAGAATTNFGGVLVDVVLIEQRSYLDRVRLSGTLKFRVGIDGNPGAHGCKMSIMKTGSSYPVIANTFELSDSSAEGETLASCQFASLAGFYSGPGLRLAQGGSAEVSNISFEPVTLRGSDVGQCVVFSPWTLRAEQGSSCLGEDGGSDLCPSLYIHDIKQNVSLAATGARSYGVIFLVVVSGPSWFRSVVVRRAVSVCRHLDYGSGTQLDCSVANIGASEGTGNYLLDKTLVDATVACAPPSGSNASHHRAGCLIFDVVSSFAPTGLKNVTVFDSGTTVRQSDYGGSAGASCNFFFNASILTFDQPLIGEYSTPISGGGTTITVDGTVAGATTELAAGTHRFSSFVSVSGVSTRLATSHVRAAAVSLHEEVANLSGIEISATTTTTCSQLRTAQEGHGANVECALLDAADSDIGTGSSAGTALPVYAVSISGKVVVEDVEATKLRCFAAIAERVFATSLLRVSFAAMTANGGIVCSSRCTFALLSFKRFEGFDATDSTVTAAWSTMDIRVARTEGLDVRGINSFSALRNTHTVMAKFVQMSSTVAEVLSDGITTFYVQLVHLGSVGVEGALAGALGSVDRVVVKESVVHHKMQSNGSFTFLQALHVDMGVHARLLSIRQIEMYANESSPTSEHPIVHVASLNCGAYFGKEVVVEDFSVTNSFFEFLGGGATTASLPLERAGVFFNENFTLHPDAVLTVRNTSLAVLLGPTDHTADVSLVSMTGTKLSPRPPNVHFADSTVSLLVPRRHPSAVIRVALFNFTDAARDNVYDFGGGGGVFFVDRCSVVARLDPGPRVNVAVLQAYPAPPNITVRRSALRLVNSSVAVPPPGGVQQEFAASLVNLGPATDPGSGGAPQPKVVMAFEENRLELAPEPLDRDAFTEKELQQQQQQFHPICSVKTCSLLRFGSGLNAVVNLTARRNRAFGALASSALTTFSSSFSSSSSSSKTELLFERNFLIGNVGTMLPDPEAALDLAGNSVLLRCNEWPRVMDRYIKGQESLGISVHLLDCVDGPRTETETLTRPRTATRTATRTVTATRTRSISPPNTTTTSTTTSTSTTTNTTTTTATTTSVSVLTPMNDTDSITTTTTTESVTATAEATNATTTTTPPPPLREPTKTHELTETVPIPVTDPPPIVQAGTSAITTTTAVLAAITVNPAVGPMAVRAGLLAISSACGEPLTELDVASNPTRLTVSKMDKFKYWTGAVCGNGMLACCLAAVIIAAVYQYQSLCDKKGDRQLNVAFAVSSIFWLILSQPTMVGFFAVASYAPDTENRWYRLVICIGVCTVITIVVYPMWIFYRVHKEQPITEVPEEKLPEGAPKIKRLAVYFFGSYKNLDWGDSSTDLRMRWGFLFEHTKLISFVVLETLFGFAINVTIGMMQDPHATKADCRLRAVVVFVCHLPPTIFALAARCMLTRFDTIVVPTMWTMNSVMSLLVMLKLFDVSDDMDIGLDVVTALVGAIGAIASLGMLADVYETVARARDRKRRERERLERENEELRRMLEENGADPAAVTVAATTGGVSNLSLANGSLAADSFVRIMLNNSSISAAAVPTSASGADQMMVEMQHTLLPTTTAAAGGSGSSGEEQQAAAAAAATVSPAQPAAAQPAADPDIDLDLLNLEDDIENEIMRDLAALDDEFAAPQSLQPLPMAESSPLLLDDTPTPRQRRMTSLRRAPGALQTASIPLLSPMEEAAL